MSKVEAVRPAAVAATILCAGLLGTWFWIKIHQGFTLEVTAGTQTLRIAAAALVLAPALKGLVDAERVPDSGLVPGDDETSTHDRHSARPS